MSNLWVRGMERVWSAKKGGLSSVNGDRRGVVIVVLYIGSVNGPRHHRLACMLPWIVLACCLTSTTRLDLGERRWHVDVEQLWVVVEERAALGTDL